MQVQWGVFPTKITINNCSHKDLEWYRNIDLVMFRFPSRKKDGSYDINVPDFCKKIKESLTPSGWCIVIAYGSIENKLRPFEFALQLRESGMHLVDVISINRPWWGGKRSDTNLALSYEHVFLFCNGEKWYLDRNPIFSIVEGEKYNNVSCPGNSWDLKSFNPAENYSSILATALTKMICLLPGGVVFDPFMGGSSGIEAAVLCGHSFIGCEPDLGKYNKYSKIMKRIKKHIDERDCDHLRVF